jgi:hypothetical protein
VSLPDRTLCWVQGPPWDRTCDPVEELVGDPLDLDLLRRRLAGLDNSNLGAVIGMIASELHNRGMDPRAVLGKLVIKFDQDTDIRSHLEES